MNIDINEQYDKVYKYCYFKIKNKEVAEDITQETFLKYFEQKTYINRGKLLAYLYTIARNLCYDYYKKGETIELMEADVTITYENEVLTNIAIHDAIEELPPELKEIILLRFANDLKVIEIAHILNISRFAVMRKIDNAFKLLQTKIKKEDFYE
ncbi:MAG: RNA polymerase sigma factor [Lachnospirales bacterium]